MKYMSFLCLTLGLMLWNSCGNPATTGDQNPEVANDSQSTINFEDFFEKYRTDSVFQMAHTVFPLTYIYLDYGEEEMERVEETIQQEDWGFNNFDMGEYGELGEAFLTLADGESGSKVAEVRIMGTGVALDYVFELIDGSWHMTKYIDSSM
jgi:hypothetical protein